MKTEKRIFSVPFFAFFIFIALGGTSAFAQTPTSLYWEPEFKVNLVNESPWTYTFGIANRNLFFERLDGVQISGVNQEHIELNQFTTYKTSANSSVALGFRYRFRELFDDNRYDEFRIVEEFKYSHPDSYLNFGHRFRFEQRFRNVVDIFRLRYRIGIEKPVAEEYAAVLSTEFLYSMASGLKPEPDQRTTFKIESTAVENLKLSLGIEHRYEDYSHEGEHNFFILSGASLKL